MSYAEFLATQSYRTKKSGANVEIVMLNEANPSEVVLGAAASLNHNDNFETNPVEEAGNDGVDEHTQGRHDGSGNMQAFWTAELNDKSPTRQNFIGKSYVVVKRIPKGREGEGTVLDAYIGVKLNRTSSQVGARGNVMGDYTFVYTRRYNGAEWADLTGV